MNTIVQLNGRQILNHCVKKMTSTYKIIQPSYAFYLRLVQ